MCNIKNDNFSRQGKDLDVKAGMFDLGNGVFETKLTDRNKVRSVVAVVNEEREIALGLCPAYLMTCWCPTCLGVVTKQFLSGKEATQFLLQAAAAEQKDLPAVQFCTDYQGFGVQKGEAFLPSKAELCQILGPSNKVFYSWQQVVNINVDWLALFSSSVNEDYCVWVEKFSERDVSSWNYQCRTKGVIPIIEIKL